jgi:prolipoprotein diacylglyceryltransferase
MVFPLDIYIGSLTIPIHLILDILAFSAATIFYLLLMSKTKDQISLENRLDLIIGAALGALIGSRLLASLVDVPYTISNLSLLVIFSQNTIVGGIIGGIIGVEIAKKIKSIKIPTGDIYVFPLILGIMIGRIGCFLTGVSDRTVGLPCSLPWCFNQGDGIPRHPTSLYEILFLGLLWIFLYQLNKGFPWQATGNLSSVFARTSCPQAATPLLASRNKRMALESGVLFRFFVIAYSIFRLFVDFIKPRETLFIGLSYIQIGCLIAIIFFSIQLMIWQGKGEKLIVSRL